MVLMFKFEVYFIIGIQNWEIMLIKQIIMNQGQQLLAECDYEYQLDFMMGR